MNTIARSQSYKIYQDILEQCGEEDTKNILQSISSILDSAGPDTDTFQIKNEIRAESLRWVVFKDTISSDEVGTYIHRSRPVVHKMKKEERLLAISNGRSLRFPTWQFDSSSEDGLVPHFATVLNAMDASSFRKALWFITKNQHLNKQRPIDVLRAGKLKSVLREARTIVAS